MAMSDVVVFEALLSREVFGRAESAVVYETTHVEFYSALNRLREIGWAVDDAWEVTHAIGANEQRYEKLRKPFPLTEHGRLHVPPAEGRVIAHKACVQERMRLGDSAAEAEAYATEKIPFWLGRDVPMRGEQMALPDADEDII